MENKIVKALTERIETLGENMKVRKVTPIDAERELNSIMEEVEKLESSDRMVVMKSLIDLAIGLENQRRERKKAVVKELEEMLGGAEVASGMIEFLKALEELAKEENNSSEDTDAKCDGNCEGCSVQHREEKVSVGIDLNRLDDEEREEVLKTLNEMNGKPKDVKVTLNQYNDAIEVVPLQAVSKFDLSIILEKVKTDYDKTVVVSGIIANEKNGMIGLHLGYLLDRDIIVNFKETGMDDKQIEDFCESFIEKYLK
ncbi:hypothetical protein UT300009_29770 [Paraclostridium bifermentans]